MTVTQPKKITHDLLSGIANTQAKVPNEVRQSGRQCIETCPAMEGNRPCMLSMVLGNMLLSTTVCLVLLVANTQVDSHTLHIVLGVILMTSLRLLRLGFRVVESRELIRTCTLPQENVDPKVI